MPYDKYNSKMRKPKAKKAKGSTTDQTRNVTPRKRMAMSAGRKK